MELNYAIKIAEQYLGEELFASLNIKYNQTEQNDYLKVSRKGNDVVITYSRLSSLFRGLTYIKENIETKEYEKEFNIRFKTDGLMLDLSRNGVMKVENVKELILVQALMGQNRLLLYTEDTYEMEKYPYWGYLRGAYSKEEIKEMVNYGKDFGVELIPCIQTLGHLANGLKWGPMQKYKDTDDVLLTDNEEVYELIEDMIKTSRECFYSEDIHIGMDEAFTQGLGRYMKEHGFTNRVELFCRHLARVIKICNKYNFKPMIWSDMFFRLNDKNNEYYSCEPLPEETIKIIPEQVKLVYWDYYHNEEEIYDKMIINHRQTKNDVIFGGGTWRWKGYVPSIQKSLEMSDKALKSCVKNNVNEVFLTAWGDNGNECSFHSVYPVLAQYAVFNYQGEAKSEDIDKLLKAILDEPLDRMIKMDLPDLPGRKILAPQYNPTKYFLYQDVLLGFFDDQYKPEYKEVFIENAKILKQASIESKKFSYVYDLLSKLCDVVSIKYELGYKARKAYKENNKKELKAVTKEISIAIKKLDIFKKAVECQWMKECRAFGYEVLDGRLGFTKNRMITAKERIEKYLKGKLDKIDELEKDILPFDGCDWEVSWNWWMRNVTVNNL